MAQHGIEHGTTAAHTPEGNAVAERFNRTIMTMVRAMLFDSGLPKSMWGEALVYALAIYNRSLTPTWAA